MPESTQPHTPVQQSAWLQVGVVHTVLAFFAVYPLGQAKLPQVAFTVKQRPHFGWRAKARCKGNPSPV